MQTFRISKVQEQSYYAIRIFGIVHLLAALSLVVLLDGPGNGLRGISWSLIVLLLCTIAFLTVRIFQARAGRIHGHYVLTRNTLAILLPGQPRMFVHRKDCTGVLPGSWKLVLRNGRHLPLGSVSAKPYLKELVSNLSKVWWPGFYGTPLWRGIVEGDPEGTLDLMVDFYGRPDGRDPLLVYTAGRSHSVWQILSLAVCALIGAGFVLLVVQYWVEIVSGYISEGDMTAQMLAVFCSASGVFASTGALVYIVRQTYFQDPIKLAFVISRRSLAILHSGGQRVFLHSDSLQYFNRLSGQLYFRDGAKLIVAPYRFGSPYNGMLRLLLTSWRPERGTLPEHIYGTGSNRLLGVLLGWLCTCSLLSSSMVLSCGILLIYMLDFMTKLSERIDVSLPTLGSSTNPVVSDFHTPG